jgi:hypothetical protein
MWPVLRPERQLDDKIAKKETSDAGFDRAGRTHATHPSLSATGIRGYHNLTPAHTPGKRGPAVPSPS